MSGEEATSKYLEGGEGCCRWCEDYIYVKIYPPGEVVPTYVPLGELPDEPDEYGRSYKSMWESQKEILREALAMEGGRFKHTLIIFCWPRGEGKSLLACFVQLWKFFCWPSQQIMLGANSKDQVKFVHYDIMRELIQNSPPLKKIIPQKDIQEKEIRLRNDRGNIASIVRSISSFSGIVSNITGYTFSEIFDMKNPKFFVQLDGSIRNMPNALGVIDSTVSAKQHVLYQLYNTQHKNELLYFSYRYSKEGDPRDYWNPNMTREQLESYQIKFPFGEFERYFLNLWSAGAEKVFTPEIIEAWNYLGADRSLDTHKQVIELIERKNQALEAYDKVGNLDHSEMDLEVDIDAILGRLWPVDEIYTLGKGGIPAMADAEALSRLGNLFDTDWAVVAGVDRGDPLKRRTGARTIWSLIAKGLPGSRSNPFAFDEEKAVPLYVYFLLHLANIEDHSLEAIKDLAAAASTEFGGLDMLCGERWGLWDLAKWCEDKEIEFEPVYPTYDRQKDAFTEFFQACKTGRFKTPPILVPGSKEGDILKEEAGIFDHNIDKRWFGSPEKSEKYGVQDDAMYATGWAFFGSKKLGLDDFRPRGPMRGFGVFMNPDGSRVGRFST